MKRNNRSKSTDCRPAASLGKSAPAAGDRSALPSIASAKSDGAIRAAPALVALAAIAVYANSFAGVFVFDDASWITGNSSIRHLWPIWAPMIGTARPIAAWSFAVNYAIGGINAWGYHAVNLAIHMAAALALFGIVRRSLLHGRLAARFATAAWGLALAVAVLWLVHPLQTQSVTYICQRYESLMGLFILWTLYSFIRAQDSSRPNRWYAASVACCALALATKEVAAAAPLLVLWYDRAFVASSWREIVRRRWAYYAGLAGTWVILTGLMLSQADKFAGAGVLVVKDLTPLQYALSQPGIIAHYLRLCFWPTGLCIDYGWSVAATAGAILPPLLLVATLLALTVWAIFRWPEWSFVGAWFFLILAPTSSVFPICDLAFEHRMYLPLAAVVAGVVVGGWVAGQWLVGRGTIRPPVLRVTCGVLALFAVATLGLLTFRRNTDYHDALSLWEDTVAKAPNGARAHNNLGIALVNRGRIDEAIVHYRKALELAPDYNEAHYNLGLALKDLGQFDEAIAEYEKALKLAPDHPDSHNNLGLLLARRGRVDEAIAHYRTALELKPDLAEPYNNLGNALLGRGRLDEAIAHYRKALELTPDSAGAHNNLGFALARRGQLDEAIVHLRKALEINPDFAAARENLAALLRQDAERPTKP
jgi:protein O-mannosyl-transferase